MRTRSQSRRFAVISSLTAAGLLLAACGGGGGDGGDGDGDGDAGAAAGGTMVFGASADPVILDGAFVSDGESHPVDPPDLREPGDDRAGRHRDRARRWPSRGRPARTAWSGRSSSARA